MTWSNEEDDLSSRVTRVGLLLEPGLQIGPYRLDKRLGKGGMGEVWRAIDPTRGDDENPGYVALKFLPREIQDSSRELRRALDTFRAVQALQHTKYLSGVLSTGVPAIRTCAGDEVYRWYEPAGVS